MKARHHRRDQSWSFTIAISLASAHLFAHERSKHQVYRIRRISSSPSNGLVPAQPHRSSYCTIFPLFQPISLFDSQINFAPLELLHAVLFDDGDLSPLWSGATKRPGSHRRAIRVKHCDCRVFLLVVFQWRLRLWRS